MRERLLKRLEVASEAAGGSACDFDLEDLEEEPEVILSTFTAAL